MKPLGLGEVGDETYTVKNGRPLALLYYRDFTGRRRRITRTGDTKATARRAVLKAVESALAGEQEVTYSVRSTLAEGVAGWLVMFEGLVERGSRSPSTLDLYRYMVETVLVPGVGSLRLGEVTTPRLDRFLQKTLRDKGYATAKLARSVLSGACGWLVRQGALPSNPVRDVTPLELDRDRTARSMTPEEVRDWLSVLDGSAFACKRDLPDLARFILATGLRLGEALGVRWGDIAMDRGVVNVQRTVIRIKGGGLQASRLKSRTSYRVLVLPGWCLAMLKARRIKLGVIDGPVFPDARGGYRDRNNVGAAFRQVRTGTPFEWVKPHTYRKTVATLLDDSGASARMIADQLGHSRVSMTQDVYMGRRSVHQSVAAALDTFDPDRLLVPPVDVDEAP